MTKALISRRQLMKVSVATAAYSMLPKGALASDKIDVVIIGAGLAGLYAASNLEAMGLNVQVLEGSDRVGGRIYTLDHVHGAPEAGGQTIGSTYGRTIFTALKHGLELEQLTSPHGTEPVQQLLHINGKRILPKDWPASPANPFNGPTRKFGPDRALFELLGDVPFSSADDWQSEAYSHLDRSIGDLLREKGLSEDAIKLLGVNFGYGENLDQASLLFMLRVKALQLKAISTPGGQKRVVGGNQRLPEAMAASLRKPLLKGKVVNAIAQADDGMVVHCGDGSSYRSRFVVAAIPTPALRSIKITPELPGLQAEAVQSLAYSRVLQLHLKIKRPFWQGKGFMPNVVSNSPIERVFASDPQNSGALTNLTIWVNGEGVAPFASQSRSDAVSSMMDELHKLMPESKGAVEAEDLISWQSSALIGGAYAAWGPGQVSRYAREIARPHGNLFFAGEHTAVWSSGIEGALESGERVANEIISRI